MDVGSENQRSISLSLFVLQLDALGPAVNVLMRDLSESTTQEEAVEIFKAAVEVHLI